MNSSQRLTLASFLFAAGLVLPFLTGQVPRVGNMLLPMHLPVLLCGLICGKKYGLMVGFLLPLVRSFLFGMPRMYPTAAAMAFELAAYGFAAGFVYLRSHRRSTKQVLYALGAAMVLGRGVWAAAMTLLLGLGENGFTWQMFLSGALLNAIPGIILQLLLIPAVMAAFNRSHVPGLSQGKAV